MKYIDEFRDSRLARKIAKAIANEALKERDYKIMEFCGGHTHAIFRYGIQGLLPQNIELVHGPGCPVCVLPIGRLDNAIELAIQKDVIFCSYGDMLRVPGSRKRSLLHAKAEGADVRMIYSSLDAIALAKENPDKKVIFFAIGFETTTPPTAVVIKKAEQLQLNNFFVYCNHILTPPAIRSILDSPDVRELGTVRVDGFIGPAHVSTIIGSQPYQYFAEEYQRPVVIAGFEPLDMMQAILMLIRQMNEGRAEVENEYTRAVTESGNLKAQTLVADVFEMRTSFEWRGLGIVPYSGLKIKEQYARFDAEKVFALEQKQPPENRACECPSILRGAKKPTDCNIFGTVCTPENPIGSCMVSSEGACAAYYSYGRYKTEKE
ncbi:hydrogenase formation protein HypD [Pseudomonadota bacterium]